MIIGAKAPVLIYFEHCFRSLDHIEIEVGTLVPSFDPYLL